MTFKSSPMTQVKLPSFTELTSKFQGSHDIPEDILGPNLKSFSQNGSLAQVPPMYGLPPPRATLSYHLYPSAEDAPSSPTTSYQHGDTPRRYYVLERDPQSPQSLQQSPDSRIRDSFSFDRSNRITKKRSDPMSPLALRYSGTEKSDDRSFESLKNSSQVSIDTTSDPVVVSSLEKVFEMFPVLSNNCGSLRASLAHEIDDSKDISTLNNIAEIVPEQLLDDSVKQATEIAGALRTLKLFVAGSKKAKESQSQSQAQSQSQSPSQAIFQKRAPSTIKKPGLRYVPKGHRSTKSESSADAFVAKGHTGVNESVLLRVDPPKPFIITNSQTVDTTGITPRGNLHQELSMKPKIKCIQCGSSTTPEWRKGPHGARTLCNACGLFYSKLIRRTGVDGAANLMLERKKEGVGADRRLPNE
ncbi:unnamed protein product [Kuraishia capsulata CBS 1993]|uniref:GATA-type domain-containing protein n=1 Tax=Kuraishia capsulata CBS 1993 TaxID=1382522 RepID=W6MWH2_9ASCO|nr:uncharacterized protein KUCA_T00003418001 [Kuraishia capsulata CBS 1993]CDK27440.1 unnamed protein product [Kuraishia capsulata CBS 1993]